MSDAEKTDLRKSIEELKARFNSHVQQSDSMCLCPACGEAVPVSFLLPHCESRGDPDHLAAYVMQA